MAACSGIKADGGRCGGQAIHGSGWCFSHHPDYEEQRRQRASKGGKRGGRGRGSGELAQAKSEVREVIEAVRTGELDKGVAAVIFQGYGALLRAHEVERRTADMGDLMERLGALEEQADRLRRA